MKLERLGIAGTGLIGASIGLAARRAGVGAVLGYDAQGGTAEVARERGAVDEVVSEAAELASADLVVVAAPVTAVPEVVGALLATGDATVTDVGSTKSAVVSSVPDAARFVGGHPVTGSEARGPEHATAELFDGATWFLTPSAQTDPERYRLVHGFVSSLGATPVAIDPEAHDRLVALTSHLPHALANVLVNQAGAERIDGHEPPAGAGGAAPRPARRASRATSRSRRPAARSAT